MELAERIKFMRMFKGWSQEEMAEKLNVAASTYAKIERGQTDIPFSRLQQIVQTFKMELADFFGLNERNVFNVIGNSNTHTHNVYFCDASKFQHENEKLTLVIEQKDFVIEQKDKEIELLRQQLNEFKDIIELFKRN